MNEKLNQRLHQLSEILRNKPTCLGLLALGSCAQQERFDEWSDLDFFVMVEEGSQESYLSDLDWLQACAPLAYVFRNSRDGHKIMWEDGIYAEYAVFEPKMMTDIPFTAGKFIFKKDGFMMSEAPFVPMPNSHQEVDYAVNEILTNLHVGLCRFHRGELLSAFMIIQVHAIDQLLTMADNLNQPQTDNEDYFAIERRVEQRHPELVEVLSHSILGYHQSLQAAQVILDYLKTISPLNPKMVSKIEHLIQISNE
jgi:lincosamide nucleotidyltransferase B/F